MVSIEAVCSCSEALMSVPDVTILDHGHDSVIIIINSNAAYSLTRVYPELVRTTWEAQTVRRVSPLAFRMTCERYRISTAEATS
jgi:hypothetical protein